MASQPMCFDEIEASALAYLDDQLAEGEKALWVGTTDVAGRRKRLMPLVISCLFMLALCAGLFALASVLFATVRMADSKA